MPVVTDRDPTMLDHSRVRSMLDCEGHCALTPDDKDRLARLMHTLNEDSCISLDSARQINIVVDNGGHLTAVISMACLQNDRNGLNGRGLAEIILVLTQKRLPCDS